MAERKGVFLWYGYSEQFRLLTDSQLGKLIRSLLEYSQGGETPTFDDPVIQIAFSFLSSSDAREQKRYDKICEERRRAGEKGGRPKKANGFLKNQNTTQKSNCFSENLILNQELNLVQDPVINQELIQESGATAPAPAGDSSSDVARHKFGAYGWVRLSDEEYARLLDDLGETELERCITYIDESAQSNGNKNKWKDWNLVIRKCSRDRWGYQQRGSPRQSASSSPMDDLQQLHQMYASEGYQTG